MRSDVNFLATLVALVLFIQGPRFANAGQIQFPNIVFVNLDSQRNPNFTNLFKKVVNDESNRCWSGSSALIYISKRPSRITNELVRQALLKNDANAKRSLGKILISYSDEEVRGFDGLIAFVGEPNPRLISLTSGRTRLESFALFNTDNTTGLEDAFCAVIPQVVRKP